MTTRQKKLADLAAQVDSLAARAAAADRAVVDQAFSRLFAGLRNSLPPVLDDGLTEPRKYPTASAKFEMRLSSLDRIEAISARLSASAGTAADHAIVAGMDAGDLALVDLSGSAYIQLFGDLLASF